MNEFEEFENALFKLLDKLELEVEHNGRYVYLRHKGENKVIFLDSMIIKHITIKKSIPMCTYPLPESFKKDKDEDENWL